MASQGSFTSLASKTSSSISNHNLRDSGPQHEFDEQTIRDPEEPNEASSSFNNSSGSSLMPISSQGSTHTAESESLGRGLPENDRELATHSRCGYL